MKKKLTLIILALVAVFAMQGLAVAAEPIDAVKANISKYVGEAKASVPSITVEVLAAKMAETDEYFELVDVRGADEYEAGHLADALWAPRGKAEWIIPGNIKDPNTKIYIYCKAGSRGALVAKMLIDAGYTNVTNVTGGFGAWAKAGYPFYNAHGEVVVTKGGYGKKPE